MGIKRGTQQDRWVNYLNGHFTQEDIHLVKNPPAMQETQVQSLAWEDPLEKGMAIHSHSIVAWRIPRTEESGRLHIVHGVTKAQSMAQISLTVYICTQAEVHVMRQIFYSLEFSENREYVFVLIVKV